MAPKSSQPSGSQSSQQRTISSFFAPKPTQAAAKPKPTPKSQSASAAAPTPAPPAATNGRTKRVVVDEEDEDEEPPSKRIRSLADKDDESLPTKPLPTKQVTAAKLADRTSKYLFSSSPQVPEDDEEGNDAATQKQKERLHEKFVKKLGRPDSFAELRRRNKILSAEDGDEAGEEGEEEEEETPKATKGRKGAATKKSGSKLTPMEKQYLEIKRQHLDTVIIMEVGYKFRFFGEDARIASKELGIVCIPGRFRYDDPPHPSEAHYERFASASFPTHRLQVHVKRLVQANHKVGVVRQIETAALKAAGDNRNTPFVRKLTNLYTKGTYVDDVEGEVTAPGEQTTGYLLCLTESHNKTDEKAHIGLVAVQPATGDIIYDDFEDGFMRSDLETRLLHIAPSEFLLVGELSKTTEKLIQRFDKSRMERIEKSRTAATEAYSHVSNFYAEKAQSSTPSSSAMDLDKVHDLPEHVKICLSAMITYLTHYGLEHVLNLNIHPFSAKSYMLLNGNTLTSLEIYQNQTDYTEKGSLFWIMDRTKTRFGRRLLRKWVGRPLINKERLEERINAVEELRNREHSLPVDKLTFILEKTKMDLEKVLIRIYYKKCTRPELLAALQTLQAIASEYNVTKPKDAFESQLLKEAVASIPSIYQIVTDFLERINATAAREDDKYSFFREDFEAEDISDHKLGIAAVESELNEFRKEAAAKLGKSNVDYVTVAGIEYLIEVKKKSPEEKRVPASWAQISGTKAVARFHPPEVKRMLQERDQHKESLAAACDVAYTRFLDDISAKYQELRDCVHGLATLDALLSLATLAGQPGYVKPDFTDEICVRITGGRHPMVEQLLSDAYIPNDVVLTYQRRGLLVTGPNMGGKSSYVRSVALIAIMGQIGSYVPAGAARLSMLDAVYTRMGAFDNMLKGESTFMVELSETASILKSATPRSLVILDELGRGTSTFDGVAIAEAVLSYIISDLQCLTLFITHYQHLARMKERFKNGELRNVHMQFEEQSDGSVVFLYEVGEGTSLRSYGLNVARLARVPGGVLEVAGVKSKELEDRMEEVRVENL